MVLSAHLNETVWKTNLKLYALALRLNQHENNSTLRKSNLPKG